MLYTTFENNKKARKVFIFQNCKFKEQLDELSMTSSYTASGPSWSVSVVFSGQTCLFFTTYASYVECFFNSCPDLLVIISFVEFTSFKQFEVEIWY